jgi:hypothetical protein
MWLEIKNKKLNILIVPIVLLHLWGEKMLRVQLHVVMLNNIFEVDNMAIKLVNIFVMSSAYKNRWMFFLQYFLEY